MTTLNHLTLKNALDGLARKDFTAVELTKVHLEAMAKGKRLNAYITETADIALAQAAESDTRRAKGEARLLEGIPLAVKDLFCTTGVKTTAASHILSNFVPPYESTVTAKLWQAGGVMLGKTNMDEFAMGSSNLTSFYGPSINPWKAKDSQDDLVPGGSSGGSAAAVAGFLAMAATGSDTGGSIRQPAAFCGITGMKPTYGRCSRYGMISFASSLDQAGMFARNVEDLALTMEAIMGHDPLDATSTAMSVPSLKVQNSSVKGLRIGIPKEYNVPGMSSDISALWQKGAAWLKEQGAEIIDISLPNTELALPVYYIIAPAEASSNLARYDGVRYGLRVVEEKDGIDALYEKTRGAGFGSEVKRRIIIGTYVLSAGYADAYFRKATEVRSLICQDFARAFEKVDVILTPTAPTPAFSLKNVSQDPVTMYLNDVFTIPASLAGLPCMSVPAGLAANGLPLGLHLIGKSFDEVTVLRTAAALERAANFTLTPQEVF